MAKLVRKTQKLFASSASNNGVFGSLQAGNPQTSNDPTVLQSLPAYLTGWDDAAFSSDKLPPLEEFQGIQYGISYQQCYMLQEGVPEWDTNTTYYKGSVAKLNTSAGFKLYASIIDNNAGNALSDTNSWKLVMDTDDLYFRTSQIQDVASLPANPDANTYYFVTGA